MQTCCTSVSSQVNKSSFVQLLGPIMKEAAIRYQHRFAINIG